MKQARDPFPQLGNNLWTGSPPAEAKGLARFAGPGPAIPRVAPQHGRHLGCSRALSPSRGGAGSGPRGQAARRKQGARPRWVRKRARKRPTGRASARQGARAPGSAGLSSRRIREPTTEGVRAARIGITASPPRSPHGLSSCLVACPAKADLVLNRGSSVGVTAARMVTPLVTMSGEASTSLGNQRPPGSSRSGVVLADRIDRKRGALGRESALPLTGWRAEAVLVLPLSVGSQIP